MKYLKGIRMSTVLKYFCFQANCPLMRRIFFTKNHFSFANIFRKAFTQEDPNGTKKTASLTVFFALLGSLPVEASTKSC